MSRVPPVGAASPTGDVKKRRIDLMDLQWYRPIGNWMGRLILPKPEARSQVRGVWFEIHLNHWR